MRASTDVAALASPSTGFAVGVTTGGRYRTLPVGGTSLATPIVAAQVALAQQRSGCVLGFLNPTLYAVRGTVADVAASPTVRFAASGTGKAVVLTTFDRDTSLKARRGYDLPTGLGTLTAASLEALARP
jgi:subtilase family serine protease